MQYKATMYNKLIQLIVFGCFFPLLLIGYNKPSLSETNSPVDFKIYNNQENTDNSKSQELLNNNQLLIFIILTFILNLALIIWLILSNKNNEKIIESLKSELKDHNNFIKIGRLSNDKRKFEIKELNNKINENLRLIKSGEINLNNENIEDNYSLNNYSFIDVESKPVINSVESNIDNSLVPIYQKFQEINKQLKQLEKASQKIIISGGKSNPQPKPIPLDKDELINIYNYAPQILAEYAIPVSISAETYRRKTGKKVYLEYTINGYYWVILTEDKNIKNYWLLPNANRNIKFYRLKDSIRLLFELKGSKEFRTNILTVTKLAQLEIQASGLTWLLLQRGCIQNQRSEIINLKKTIEADLQENLNIFIEEKKKDFEIEINEILQEAKTNILKTNILHDNLNNKSDRSILDNFDKTFHEVKGIFEDKIQEFKDKLDK